MGVPGLKTLFKRRAQWKTNVRLKESKLIVDATDEMYWFVEKHLLDGHAKIDRFGFSMVAYAQLLRQFIERLRSAKITPIIVYNGARLSERIYGTMVSKTKHLEKSAQIRMYLMNKRGARNLDHAIVPSVACNVLKQVINEYQLEAHQSTYEVYPLLVRLAAENDCPVLTSHRDFILANVKRGFLLYEELELTNQSHRPESEIATDRLYRHQLMVDNSRIPSQCSAALYCLNVLLRPDFCGKYFEVVNRIFSMPAHLQFKRDNTEFVPNHRPTRPIWNKQVEYILSSRWPSAMTDADSVRRTFERHASQVLSQTMEREMAMRDFDALWLSFSNSDDCDNIVALLPESLGDIVKLQDALTKRESTAPFLTDILMGQTNIDRLRIEDLGTARSTYSLADPVKVLLMNRGRRPESQSQMKSLKLFDRQYTQLVHRSLQVDMTAPPANDIEEPGQMLYDAFMFPSQIANPTYLKAYIRESRQSASQLMKISLAFKEEERQQQTSMCEQIIVVLRLAVFATKLGFNNNYELPPVGLARSSGRSPPQSPQATGAPPVVAVKSQASLQPASSRSQSGSLTEKLGPGDKYRKILPIYLDAIYNCVFYYCFKKGLLVDRVIEAELLRNDVEGGFYAKVNLAVQEIDSNRIEKPVDVTNNHYLEIKHLNELLNSALHSYMELNSFYNYPGAVLKLADYYDCHRIYKICYHMLQAAKPNANLLKIEKTDRLYSLIFDRSVRD